MNDRLKAGAVLAAVLTMGLVPAGALAFTDNDADGMDDEYETLFLLNTSTNDAGLNPDGDSLTNGAEAVLLTDPWRADTDRDGFDDDADSNAVSRAFIGWGDPDHMVDNHHVYAAPPWLVAAFGEGTNGEWITEAPTAWHVPAAAPENEGSLHVEVNRTTLTNDPVMRLVYYDRTNATLAVDLYGAGGVVTNLPDVLMQGSEAVVTNLVAIPFGACGDPAAGGILIRRGTGEVTVYESLLYVDQDGDGLDADQEAQLGTSDQNADSDGDGLSDGDEVFKYHTNPAAADTDGDGIPDGWEVLHGLQPGTAADGTGDADGDGTSNLDEYLQGRDPAKPAIPDTAGLVNLKVFTPLEK